MLYSEICYSKTDELSQYSVLTFLTDGHDMSVKTFMVPDLLTSGEVVNFNLTLEALLIGAGSVAAPSPDKVTMTLIKHGGDAGMGKRTGKRVIEQT